MSERPESDPHEGPPAEASKWLIDEDELAHTVEQSVILQVLLSSLETLIELRGWKNALAGANNYFAWLRERPTERVSPDVYLLDNPPEHLPKLMWRTWLPGNPPPRWALELVSEDWREDYEQLPAQYDALGCRELMLFDTDAVTGDTLLRRRVPLTVHRRTDDGVLLQAYSGAGPVYSRELGVWLVSTWDGYSPRLRLSEDREGTRIVPTVEETSTALRAERPANREEADEAEEQASAHD